MMLESAQSRSIFISYRREDAGAEALNLFDALTHKYGSQAIFMDIDGIPLGVDFREYLKTNLAGCRVLLAVIGKSWLTLLDDNGHLRLNDPTDFVRFEIAAALKSEIDVIPVLVQGAAMPQSSALPEEVKSLCFRNGTKLSHDHWKSDTSQLVNALEPYLRPSTAAPVPVPVVPPIVKAKSRLNWTLTITLCAFAAVFAVGLGLQNWLGAGPRDLTAANAYPDQTHPTPSSKIVIEGSGGTYAPSGPIRVPPDTMSGYLVASPAPVQPAGSKPGTVTLHAIISRSGNVGSLSVVSGPESLQASALDAVRNWRYKPYSVNGKPVEVDTTIIVAIGSVFNGYHKAG